MTHIQQRRDTAANWASANPVLYDGESGHESDTGRWKLGNGVTPWNLLPYKLGVDSVAGRTGDVDLDVIDVFGAAPLESPEFTGNPTAPTPNPADDDTTIATTAFVQAVVAAAIADAKLAMHPVGSLYFSETNVDPATFLGGTWIAWGSGRVPVGVDPLEAAFDVPGKVGGEIAVTLTAAQSGLPAHGHTVNDLGHSHGSFIGYSEMGTHDWEFVTASPGTGHTFNLDTGTSTDPSATGVTVADAAAANAVESHTNLQPYITCYMWKRTM